MVKGTRSPNAGSDTGKKWPRGHQTPKRGVWKPVKRGTALSSATHAWRWRLSPNQKQPEGKGCSTDSEEDDRAGAASEGSRPKGSVLLWQAPNLTTDGNNPVERGSRQCRKVNPLPQPNRVLSLLWSQRVTEDWKRPGKRDILTHTGTLTLGGWGSPGACSFPTVLWCGRAWCPTWSSTH